MAENGCALQGLFLEASIWQTQCMLKQCLADLDTFLLAFAVPPYTWTALDAACRQLLLKLPSFSSSQLQSCLSMLLQQEVVIFHDHHLPPSSLAKGGHCMGNRMRRTKPMTQGGLSVE